MERTNFLFLFFSVAALLLGCTAQQAAAPYHTHADFKVYVNGTAANFSGLMYQVRAKEVHVEDGIGEVVHIHQQGIMLGHFLETLGVQLNESCITVPIQGSSCSQAPHLYVNGLPRQELGDYVMQDSDKILVTYGEGDIQEQMASITDMAGEKRGMSNE